MKKNPDVDAYISKFPAAHKKLLKEIRAIIRTAAPLAEEVTSYGMPAYKYNGMLVYFAGWEKHVAIYPMPSGIIKFQKELSKYKTSKSTAQFPIGEKLPTTLITKIVKFRVAENEAKKKKSYK